MSKPHNKSITYLRLAVIFGILMAGVIGVISWLILSTAKDEIMLPVVSEVAGDGTGKLDKGDIIETADIAFSPVAKYGLSPNIVTNPNTLVGKYVTRDYYSGEHFWAFNLVTDYPKTLSERVRYSAVPVPVSLITSVNADIQEDDFVKVSIIIKKDNNDMGSYESTDITGKLPDSGVTIIEAEELQAVRVVGFYNSAGQDITEAKRMNNMSKNSANYQSISPSFIVFDANPIQQALLLQGVYGGSIQLVIIPDETQNLYKREWGLIDAENKKVENPLFIDDSQELEQRQQDILDAQNTQTQQENEKIDGLLDAIENGDVPVTEDPNLENAYPPGVEPNAPSSNEIIDLS